MLSTGVELEYSEQGNPDGAPVILIHGYGDTRRTFELNLPNIPRSFHVFAVTMRGHGDSSKPVCCYTHADFAADVVAFMDAKGLTKASIVGTSMGSFIAHKVAVTYPQRVNRLILLASAPTAAGNPNMLGAQEYLYSITELDPGFVEYFVSSAFYRPVPADFLAMQIEETAKMPLHVWQQAVDALLAEDHTALLPTITRPTLIITGDNDPIFTMEEKFALQAAIPNSRMFMYANGGHMVYAELPHRTTCDIVRFLASRDPSAGPALMSYNPPADIDDCSQLTPAE